MSISACFQPDDALPCGPQPADDAEARALLGRVLADSGPAERPADVVRVITAAARAAMAGGPRHALCLRLANAAPVSLRDGPALALLRCRSLQGLADYPALAGELRRLANLRPIIPARDARLAQFAGRWGLGWLLPRRAGLDCLLSGELPEDPADWYFPPARPAREPLVPDHRAAAWASASGRTLDAATRARIEASARQCERDRALWRADGLARVIPAASADDAARAASLHRLTEHALRDLVTADLRALQASVDSGRNVLVLRAHAGVRLPDLALGGVQARRVMVANGDFPKAGWSVTRVAGDATAAMAFVKLARAMRAGGHLVLMMPDGGQGSEFGWTEVCGLRFRVALGAAALARVAPSQLFFARTILQQGRFVLNLIPGPQIDPTMPREAAEAALVTFYADGIRSLLTGAPEDLGELRFLQKHNRADPDE